MNQEFISEKQYLLINIILAGIILMIFAYSTIFTAERDNHPIPSFYEELTGQTSPSSGMSRAFSEIIRGSLDAAREYNPDSLLIFSFFLIQLLQRGVVSILIVRKKTSLKSIVLADTALSVALLLYCFRGQMPQ